jgi:hypothetical protein
MTELQIKKIEIEGQTRMSFEVTPTDEEFKLKYDEIEKDYSINKLRIERNVLLKDCDWVMMSDLDLANKDEWVIYRQALRDLPKTQSGVTTDIAGNLIDAVFPIKPE